MINKYLFSGFDREVIVSGEDLTLEEAKIKFVKKVAEDLTTDNIKQFWNFITGLVNHRSFNNVIEVNE